MVPFEIPATLSLFYASRWWLIDDRPENSEFLDRIDEFVKVDRLYHIGKTITATAIKKTGNSTPRKWKWNRSLDISRAIPTDPTARP